MTANRTPIRVLIVDDSLTVRARLREVLTESPDFEVVGEAQDGREAIAQCDALRPDVITMDMALPVMSGLSATEYIMAHRPTPILIVSASFNRGDVFKTYDALAAGAVDVFEKPNGQEDEGAWELSLQSALRVVSRVKVITRPRGRPAQATPQAQTIQSASQWPSIGVRGEVPGLIAIGASTGGPGALVNVLRGLSGDVRQPVLIVMHLSPAFSASFADWLNEQVERPVRFAREGETLASLAGEVRLAPADSHLEVVNRSLRLTRGPERHSCRPSVDVLFESLAVGAGSRVAACLLTGMGRDGASGLLALRKAGAITLAQDEASSAVYGMPREAVLLDAVERVLPLSEVGPTLTALCARGARQ